jgi:hypothetical protein
MAKDTNQLNTLAAEMDAALRSARTGLTLVILLAIASSGICGGYLIYAHNKFTETATPENGVNVAVAYVQRALPEYGPKLAQAARDAAPKVLDSVEAQLEAIPARLSKELQDRSTAEVSKLMPQAEEEMYKSLKAALAEAKANRPSGASDDAYATAVIDHLATTYGDESLKLLGDVQAKYGETSGDLIKYLQRLADDKGLTRKESLQRQALVTFLTIASRTQKSQG